MGFNIQTLRGILEDEGLYVRSLPTLWTEAEVRVLRSDPPAGVIAAARAGRVLAMKSTTGDGFDVTAQIQFTTTPCTSAGVASG
jgi:hypothetical protein